MNHPRRSTRLIRRWGLVATLTGAATLLYGFALERKWLAVANLTLQLPRLDRAFDGYRIVQVSDLHAETWFPIPYMYRVVEQVNAQQPDLIALTGDFVHRNVYGVADELSAALRGLHAPDGVLGVLGNHDHWGDGEAVRRAVIAGGVHDLNNTVHTIRRGSAALHIGGVDSYLENRARLDLVLDDLPDDGAAILLAHEPDFAHVSAATGRFDLQLSGHSHGGQVRLPGVMQMALPKFGERYNDGLYHIANELLLYVNRGVGVSELPLRLNCRPEISVITLRAMDSPPSPRPRLNGASARARRVSV